MDDTTTTEATEHSPLPWTYEDDGIWFGDNHLAEILGNDCDTPTDRANGRFIVDAVNSVDRLRGTVVALVTALKEHVEWTIDPCGDDQGGYICDCDRSGLTRALIEHRVGCPVPKSLAALALAAASHGDNDAAVDGALAAMEIGTQKRFGNRAIERRGVDSFDIADEADPQLPFLKGLSLAEAAAYIAKGPTE